MKPILFVCSFSFFIIGAYLGAFLKPHPIEESPNVTLTKTMKLHILKHNYSGALIIKVTTVNKDKVQEGVLNYTLENGLKGQAYLEKGDSYYVGN